MRGTLAKKFRRQNGGQELAHLRRYQVGAGKRYKIGTRASGQITLNSNMSRVGYQMDKKEYKAERGKGNV